MRLADTNAFRSALLALTKFELEEHDRLLLALIAFQELLDLLVSYWPSDVGAVAGAVSTRQTNRVLRRSKMI
jgi:hypothetical protein